MSVCVCVSVCLCVCNRTHVEGEHRYCALRRHWQGGVLGGAVWPNASLWAELYACHSVTALWAGSGAWHTEGEGARKHVPDVQR